MSLVRVEFAGPDRHEAEARRTSGVWKAHEEARRIAEMDEEEREAEADRLLREHGPGDVRLPHAQTRRRHRTREVPLSQLENPSYSGTRQLLESMAEGLCLVDTEAQADLDGWVIHWEVSRAIRGEPMLSHEEKEALLGRLRGESLRETAKRMGVSYQTVRRLLGSALARYDAGKLPRLRAVSEAGLCFLEEVSRRIYRRPNCCGQSPLCVDGAAEKPCARWEHTRPEATAEEDVRPGDLNYCPLRRFSEWPWGRW